MWRRRKYLVVLLVDFLAVTVLFFFLDHLMLNGLHMRPTFQSYMSYNDFAAPLLHVRSEKSEHENAGSISTATETRYNCTMKECFDFARCRRPSGFKIYVYPDKPDAQRSKLFEDILTVIRSSPYYTSDPEEACLFVPSTDTLDRDKHSPDFVKNLAPFSSLPHWNGGRNHLLFVQFSGTWPDYSNKLDFSTGRAILARASFGAGFYRKGFDVSLPLMHKEHPLYVSGHSGVLSQEKEPGFLPVKRKYLLVFKGKRYLYGQGSRIRSSLYHLLNNKDVIMLTTCKHNEDWLKYTDDRCDMDNALYDRYDYDDLMKNSSFCLAPRGRRLGSYRFLEALQSSCVPVSLSNGYILPFSEVLDWSRVSLVVDERQLLQLPYILREVAPSKLLSFRLQTQLLWDAYFSSVSKIITTTLEIIHNRIETQPNYIWNQPPGHIQIHRHFSINPLDYPNAYHYPPSPLMGPPPSPPMVLQPASTLHSKFTVILTLSRPAVRDSSPVLQLLQSLANAALLEGVVLLWAGHGEAQIASNKIPVPSTVIDMKTGDSVLSVWPVSLINTSAVLHLSDNALISSEEASFGFSAWKAFPSRLLGFIGHSHSWDHIQLQWAHSIQPHNYISMVSTDAVFYHRYYGFIASNFLPLKIRLLANQSPSCLNVVFNFIASQHSLAPPLLLPWRGSPRIAGHSANQAGERVACINLAANAFGNMPLLYSHVRLDPVLYKDDVSVSRKEYRKMEAPS